MHAYHHITTCTDPCQNLAVEAYLLETVPADAIVLYLWRNANTVVIGANQNAWKECRVKELEESGGHLVRRLSGGGAVYHDLGNLNFTFLVNKVDYDVTRQIEVILQAVRSLGIDAQRTGRNDIEADGRKFSGNAFFEHAGKCYHHGTLLLDTDTATMQRYLIPSSAKLASKGVDSVRSRVVNLKELLPSITTTMMEDALVASFSAEYGCESEPLDPANFDQKRLAELTEHFSSWEWRLGRKIPFDVEVSSRFAWGEVCLQLVVNEGIIHDAQLYSDCLDVDLFSGLDAQLCGLKFSSASIANAMDAYSAQKAARLSDDGADPSSASLAQTAYADLRSLVEAQGW